MSGRAAWPPLQRAVDALRARAQHGTVMPFGRRKAARVLAEYERRGAELERLRRAAEPTCVCVGDTCEMSGCDVASCREPEGDCPAWTAADDPLVEAPGFGVTNREYWPLSQVKAAEEAATGKCGICEIDWQLCRGLYDKGLPRCCSDCTHDLHAQEVTRRP